MPTKPNRSGEQQNYVPPGNGDASGEYGDNATGSNIHYQSKGEETKPIKVDIKQEPPKNDKPKDIVKNKQDNAEYVKNNSTIKGKTLKTLNEIINKADDECVDLLNKAYSKQKYSFSIGSGVYRSYYKQLKCDKSDFVENGRGFGKVGSVWFHENGHLLDNSYSENYKEWASTSFKDEKGNTLYDYLQEELKDLMSKENYIEEFTKLKTKYKEEKISKQEEEELEKLKQMRREVNTDEAYKKDIELLKTHGYSTQYLSEKNKIYEENYKQGMGEENYNRYKELENKLSDAIKYSNSQYYTDVSPISDVLSSKINMGLGVGHPLSYYRKTPKFLAIEFFANMFSAKSVGSNSAIELTKKHFPKSCAMFEKILKEAF